jgi:very-short-patch-repair endonuclease
MRALEWTLRRHNGGQPSTRWDERHLARLGATQDGIVRIDQLTDLGLTRDARQRRTAQRRLVPLHRGVYAVGHNDLTERGRFRAAAWACGDSAHLSDLASARLMNLWERPVRRIDVIVPPSRRPRVKGLTIHRASLTSPETTHVRGIPCTSVSRTLVDLATTPALEAVFERAERRKLIRPDVIEALLHGRPGAARLRALLATHRPKSKATKSLLERRLLAELRRRGLPEPLVNETLVLDALTLEPDLMWPAYRVLVELDGLETHGTRTAQRRDRRRDRATVLAKWLPLRFTWDDVEQELPAVAAEIETAIT